MGDGTNDIIGIAAYRCTKWYISDRIAAALLCDLLYVPVYGKLGRNVEFGSFRVHCFLS